MHGSGMKRPEHADRTEGARRNRAYAATHQALIEAAVRLISEKGAEALSVAGLARAVAINRTTVYYHFASREELLHAVSIWSAEQLSHGLDPQVDQEKRIDFIARFVLENPDLIKIWMEDFVSAGDIRERYPKWDELVAGTQARFDQLRPGESADAEVFCTLLLTGAIIGPRVFRNSVRPDLDDQSIIERFRAEQQRMLRLEGL